ncbi:rho GTPase-activating protein 15-like isoform X2 [Ptychodera flava]|uniref:rho GTPase-activating protein 15-like isoform X2 n=1 Tax=Ptychodera flava TaxID=63121 RepID=UPI00396A31E6
MADDGKGARLRAQYPYKYRAADGADVSFEKGDEFTLVKRSGNDWWFVRRDGDKNPVYVPARYMIEISSPSHQFNGGGGLSGSVENLASEVPSQRVPIPVPDYYEETENSVSSQGYSDVSSSSEILNVTTSSQASVGSTGSPEPPLPTRPPSQVLSNNWEVHYDDKQRKFYYNTITKESCWKPPRSHRVTSPPKTNLPHGWRQETDDHGDPVYINEHTNDKWHTSQDPSGKVYYYSDNGIDTAWELPEFLIEDGVYYRYSEAEPMPRSHTDGNLALEEGWMRNQTRSTYDRASRTQSMMVAGGSPSSNRKSATLPGNLSAPHNDPSEGIQRSFSDLAVHDTVPNTDRSGQVNRAKISENGKKIKKNWCSSYLILSSPLLFFYKDQKSASGKSGSPTSKPEATFHLKGAIVEWTKDKSSKKYVFQLSTLSGTEYLIQCDNAMASQQWYESLATTINRLSPVPGRRQPSVDYSDDDDDSEGPPPMRSDSSGKDDQQKKVGGRLKRLLSIRPKKETLERKGIIKDRVFGSDLVQLCEKEKSPVPKIVIQCITAVEKRGIDVDGIYRVSGNMSQIQKLRVMIDQEQHVNLFDPKWDDIHVIAGTLKLFFRELKEPLFPFKFFDKFIGAIRMRDRKQRLKAFKGLIGVMPRPNQDTMRVLFQHLDRVCRHERQNRMNAQSVAIVFGPTLLWPEIETGNMAVNLVCQNQIVEFILLEIHNIFPE